MAFLRHYENEAILVIINTASTTKEMVTLSIIGSTIQPGEYGLNNLVSNSDTIPIMIDDTKQIQNLEVGAYETIIYKFSDDPGTAIERTILDNIRLNLA